MHLVLELEAHDSIPSQDARLVIKLKQNIVEECVVVVQKFVRFTPSSLLFLASIFRTRFLLSSSEENEKEGGGGQLGKYVLTITFFFFGLPI